MKKLMLLAIVLVLAVALSACGGGEAASSQAATSSATEAAAAAPTEAAMPEEPEPEELGRGDLIEEVVPDGADVLSQGVYYYELLDLAGDAGEGLSAREGAELVNEQLAVYGLYDGGVSAEQCVYISLDELAVLDAAMGNECYIYSVGVGTPEGGLMGDGYEVVYRFSVDYGGEKVAALYEDYSGDPDDYDEVPIEEGATFTLTLVADFSAGSTAEGTRQTKEITLPVEGYPASPHLIATTLASELSGWTGLDFTLNDVTFEEDSITVDWAADSTLIAGLGDKEQNPEFFMYDAVSMNWFLMDSLAETLKYNMDVSTIYYNVNGGPVTFLNPEDMAADGLPELPPDQPYEGSAFFVSHAGAMG